MREGEKGREREREEEEKKKSEAMQRKLRTTACMSGKAGIRQYFEHFGGAPAEPWRIADAVCPGLDLGRASRLRGPIDTQGRNMGHAGPKRGSWTHSHTHTWQHSRAKSPKLYTFFFFSLSPMVKAVAGYLGGGGGRGGHLLGGRLHGCRCGSLASVSRLAVVPKYPKKITYLRIKIKIK